MDEVSRRIGRRGAYLLAFASIYGIYGFGLATWPTNEPVPEAYVVLADLAPMSVHGYIWVALSLVCAVAAFFRRDRIGFASLELMAGSWAIGALIGAYATHEARGYVAGLLFAGFACSHFIVAGMSERQRGVGGGRQ